MSVYNDLKDGKSVSWNSLDEQGRYEVWSLHCEAVGENITYPEFCDIFTKWKRES